MTNAIAFLAPVDDEFFAAHQSSNDEASTLNPGSKTTVYSSDKPVNVLGCAAQTQFCLGKNKCTPLTGFVNAAGLAVNMTVTDRQSYSLVRWIANKGNLDTELSGVIHDLGPTALLARQSLSSDLQGPVPLDQWQREVEHWQATTMAKLQKIAVEFATGPSDASIEQYVMKPSPSDKAASDVCRNQVRASHS